MNLKEELEYLVFGTTKRPKTWAQIVFRLIIILGILLILGVMIG